MILVGQRLRATERGLPDELVSLVERGELKENPLATWFYERSYPAGTLHSSPWQQFSERNTEGLWEPVDEVLLQVPAYLLQREESVTNGLDTLVVMPQESTPHGDILDAQNNMNYSPTSLFATPMEAVHPPGFDAVSAATHVTYVKYADDPDDPNIILELGSGFDAYRLLMGKRTELPVRDRASFERQQRVGIIAKFYDELHEKTVLENEKAEMDDLLGVSFVPGSFSLALHAPLDNGFALAELGVDMDAAQVVMHVAEPQFRDFRYLHPLVLTCFDALDTLYRDTTFFL